MTLEKIISGGQTGVDRGALDAALDKNFPCGGWCPPGRLAEDDPVDRAYPLAEMKHGGYPERTRQNVIDSDATLIIHFGPPEGGTKTTLQYCLELGKPHLLVDAWKIPEESAAELAQGFVEANAVKILNVAGPRHSKAPEARDYAYKVISLVLDIDEN